MLPESASLEPSVLLGELDPGARPLQEAYSTGQAEDGPLGDIEFKRVSSETCVSGTVRPVGPDIEVNRSAAGRGAPASR